MAPKRENKLVVLHQFTVEARGSYPAFPFDMLRYDRCWPKSEGGDSATLERITQRFGKSSRDLTHGIRVSLEGLNYPTSARWSSFGWSVIEHYESTVG